MSGLRNNFASVLHRIGLRDPNLIVLVGDISHYRLQPFAKDCPGRYYNIGICEPTIVNMAAGLSKVGFYPVVHTISPFIVERSFEQLKLDFCYQELGGNIMTAGSAFDYAYLGCTHHCYNDFGLLKTLPGTQLFYPCSETELECLFSQVYQLKALNYFRLPMFEHGISIEREKIIPGKGIMISQGKDVTLVAIGTQLKSAYASLSLLHKRGLSADLIYIHTLKPLDDALITSSLERTRKGIVIEEHGIYANAFDDILRVSYRITDLRLSSVSIPHRFLRDYGSYQEYCQRLGFSAEGITHKVLNELFDGTL